MSVVRVSSLPLPRTAIDLAADHAALPFERWAAAAGILSAGSTAGFPVLLPAGARVFEGLRAVVRRHMQAAGFAEMTFPTLYPAALLERSGRMQRFSRSVYTCRRDGHTDMIVAPTHEEWIAEFFSRAALAGAPGQRTLPARVYQLGRLVRDLGGGSKPLLKANEFELLEAYTVCADELQQARTSAAVDATFGAVFTELGLRGLRFLDRGASYTDHLVEHERGEYRLFVSPAGHVSEAPGRCAICGAPLTARRGGDEAAYCCAAGHESPDPGTSDTGEMLSMRRMFTVAMSMRVPDVCVAPFGDHPVVMGTHGLGLLRLLLAIHTEHRDGRGVAWPAGMEPYTVTVIPRSSGDVAASLELCERLARAGVDAIADDRSGLSAYGRVLSSELAGIPFALEVSASGRFSVIPRGARGPHVAKTADADAALRLISPAIRHLEGVA